MSEILKVCVGCEDVAEKLEQAKKINRRILRVQRGICKECRSIIENGDCTPNELRQINNLRNR